MRIDLNANEFVLKAADTRHYSEEDKIDGKLVLTNQRIYFTTVSGVKNKLQMEIKPREINEVMNFNNRFIFSNGLCILMNNGKLLKFEIKNRNQWAQMIAKII